MPRLRKESPTCKAPCSARPTFAGPTRKARSCPARLSTISPAIGGVLSAGAGQTPLTEFLRYGAAGSSGTVCEPYAIQNKFPVPAIQVHYARGCSLAEAFYQSVWGPYQLLIVGDPLCRPWARIPAIHVSGVEAGATVHGRLILKPTAEAADKAAAANCRRTAARNRTSIASSYSPADCALPVAAPAARWNSTRPNWPTAISNFASSASSRARSNRKAKRF